MPEEITPLTLVVSSLVASALAVLLYRYPRLGFRGVPVLSPEAMGLFRIVFGLALFVGMAHHLQLPDAPPPGGSPGEAELWEAWGWVDWLGDHWGWRDGIQTLTLVAIVCFTIGLLPRAAYVLVVVGFVVRLLVAQEYGAVSHQWVLYPLALLPLMLVPWGDGPTVDTIVRRRLGRAVPSREPSPRYGLAVWLPGLALGIVWLAAAAAKLDVSGPAWVTGGAVRYHWAEDHLAAPTSWGAWVAGQESLAVVLSGAGLAVEALFITHVLFRSQLVRFGYGLVAFSLLLGFYLMQGLVWYGWWTIILAFVPWEALARLARRAAGALRAAATTTTAAGAGTGLPALSPAVSVVVALMLSQQLAISHASIEQMPFFSNYPMYSYTRASPEAFNEEVAPYKFFRYRAFSLDGTAAPRDISHELDVANALSILHEIGVWLERHPGQRLDPALTAKLADVRARYEARYGTSLRRLRLTGERRVFDFDHGRLVVVGQLPPVTVDFDALTVSS